MAGILPAGDNQVNVQKLYLLQLPNLETGPHVLQRQHLTRQELHLLQALGFNTGGPKISLESKR